MGISIAIDDFGTGYSALSYLARFPINTLKIDRSFINSITLDSYRAELVKAIISIARCLGQEVVAEGVETLEQAAFLQAQGCQMAQGYLYSKPVARTAFELLPRSYHPDFHGVNHPILVQPEQPCSQLTTIPARPA
jgi:EAL domain-containing protein (putative c-di-GMP-specific phosphodiesterase class I)